MRQRAQSVLVLLAMSSLAGCGTPEPPNLRQKFDEGIRRLGMIAFYPLNESARLGQVYLVDETVGEEGDVAAYIPTSVYLTDAAVPWMEAARAGGMEAKKRFPCSADNLAEQINPERSYYRQSTCAAPATAKPPAPTTPRTPPTPTNPQAAAAAHAAAAQAAAAAAAASAQAAPPAAARPAEPVLPGAGQPSAAPIGTAETLPPLALAGLPTYTLASVDNLSLAGSAPTQFANFLAAIGWRQTTSLRVEAEGVEIAKLPTDKFTAAITGACGEWGNPFSNPKLAKASLEFAKAELVGFANIRKEEATEKGIELQEEPPKLYMLREVYYLRGIRYIFSDTRAYAAMAEAAAKSGVKAASQPPVVPNISMNVVTPASPGTQPAQPSALSGEIAALQSQIDALRSAISSNANIQAGATYARATARGIEFVELFQRH
jgi:hypothetical protein